MELIEITTTTDLVVPFEWHDTTPGGSNLGHAEFHVRLVYKRSKLQEYYVWAGQQRNIKNYWHRIGCDDFFRIISFDGLEPAWVWLFCWCKEHKAQEFSLYAPKNSKFLTLSYYGLEFSIENIRGKNVI